MAKTLCPNCCVSVHSIHLRYVLNQHNPNRIRLTSRRDRHFPFQLLLRESDPGTEHTDEKDKDGNRSRDPDPASLQRRGDLQSIFPRD